jgi:hypothetical protein
MYRRMSIPVSDLALLKARLRPGRKPHRDHHLARQTYRDARTEVGGRGLSELARRRLRRRSNKIEFGQIRRVDRLMSREVTRRTRSPSFA